VLQDRGAKLVGNRDMSAAAETSRITAPRAGAELRAARERLAWPLASVAAELRIRLSYLEALEEGRLDLLPGNTYALGFLRLYASALGLDAEETVRRFRAEAVEVTHPADLTFPAPAPERGLPAGAVMLVGLVLAACAYAGWYRLSGEGRLTAEVVTPIPARLASLAEQALPPVPEPPAAPAVEAAVTPAPEPAPAVPSISPSSAAAAPVNPLPVPDIPPAAPADQARIVLRATADAWVQVRDRAGPVLLNRVLKPGETWSVPARPNLLLSVGNAGGTEVLVDGAPTAGLGGAGVVRKDLPLDPDLIKEGKLAMSPAGSPAGRSAQ
jgi:cytoskeleton protein RodZ